MNANDSKISRVVFNLISRLLPLTAIIGTLSIFVLIILSLFHPSFNDYKFVFSRIDPELASKMGDFIGGYFGTIVLIITAFLLFLTLQEQKKACTLQSFESKFYDLLKIHRDNVAEMNLGRRKGRSVFVILRAEFQDIYETVKKHYSANESDNRAKANITYILLFFGVKDSGAEMAHSLLDQYDKVIIEKIVNELNQIKNAKECKYLKKYTEMPNYEPFNGHQSRLGHYFRHLYQIVKFVDKQTILSKEDKEFYMRTLRAQLSNHELAVFFYNSLSAIGKNWRVGETKGNCFIDKYELLKNIPLSGFTYDLNPEKFYKLDYKWYEIKKTIFN